MLADRPGPGNKGGRKRREIVPIPDDVCNFFFFFFFFFCKQKKKVF